MDRPRQWPFFILLTLVSFPLAPIWWWLCAGSARTDYWQSGWVRKGLQLVIGSAVMLLAWPLWGRLFSREPSDNPIGIGLLYVLLTLIGIGMTIVGDVLVAQRRRENGEPI